MTRLSKLGTAAGALALALASPAAADEFADSVHDFDGVTALDCCDNPNDALGPNDATGTDFDPDPDPFSGFVTIESGGFLTLDFDNNLCFVDSTAAADLTVYEHLGGETFNVAVGLQGGALSASVDGSGEGGPDGEDLDFSGVAPDSLFNRARLDSTSNAGTVPGVDVDAMECLFTLDQADIEKDFAENPEDNDFEDEIFAGLDTQQYKAFTITITNNTGVDDAFDGLTFFDVVPAEWDASGDSEAADADGDGAPNNDGIAVVSGNCTASIVEHQSNGSPNSKGNALKPEFISITADLDDTESCVIKVWVGTDSDHPGRGRSPVYTPTSCPVTLNDGVRVLDSSGGTLFEDDDSLIFVDAEPGDLEDGQGVCDPG